MGGDRSLDNSPRTCSRRGGDVIVRTTPEIEKGRSPAKLELLSVDARRTPAENVWRPASTTDRRDICLLLTQDAGCLKGSKRPGALKSPGKETPARNLKWRNALGSIPLSIILPEPLQVRALLLHPGIYYTYHRLA